ncbi:hypothetical protein BT63DRAFT_436337 [Microthyrium microscopicum]|uniref:Uncharacterized protein n=1 Tax=Microthyrium microscopicum TaxID=703497 RepID=A0A6A6UWJ7_9PEZI|nr:hypothetical protein BT63DRAFT_436337 [Microthyrium microscopicum]
MSTPDRPIAPVAHVSFSAIPQSLQKEASSGSSSLQDDASSVSASESTSPTPDSTRPSLNTQTSSNSNLSNSMSSHNSKVNLIEGSLENILEDTKVVSSESGSSSRLANRRFLPLLDGSARPGRKTFTPILIETSRRSRKAGDSEPGLTLADKTDAVSCRETIYRKRRLMRTKASTPRTASLAGSFLSNLEARRLGIPLPRRSPSSSSTLSHCYRPTDLDTIESSESDRSAPASPSTSYSVPPSPIPQHLTPRDSNSIDTHSTGRLIALAARNAEKQLRERGLAAFPTHYKHQSVNHFIDTASHTPIQSTFSSQHEMDLEGYASENWELREIQKHHEVLQAQRDQQQKRKEAKRKLLQRLEKRPGDKPFAFEQCAELAEQKACAEGDRPGRPPMLGHEIVFPRSASPDRAMFDVTQAPESFKQTMCYLSGQAKDESCSGLWDLKSPQPTGVSSPPVVWSTPASRAPSTGNGGLWGGSCLDSNTTSPSRGPTGLLTPRFTEDQGHFPKDNSSLLKESFPPSPPASMTGKFGFEDLQAETEEISIEAEFSDEFVTQVYNYMSLGYPSVAKDFDAELSKVTRVPIEELRKDDHLPDSRGYIRLGEDANPSTGVTEENCARWKALKMYILEWAHQRPAMVKNKETDPSFNGTRKGSWQL